MAKMPNKLFELYDVYDEDELRVAQYYEASEQSSFDSDDDDKYRGRNKNSKKQDWSDPNDFDQ